jgi:acetyltransferase-like isoleucine patch superfamily enzyme
MAVSLGTIFGIKNKKGKIENSHSSNEPFFTKDFFKNESYKIGEFTYGKPHIFHWGEKADLSIGKYCSIARDVKIFLGGNHRTDWVSTYPFNVISDNFPKAKNIQGHPATRGDVIIGNDVWIGYSATIFSGVTIGDGAVIGAFSVVTKNVKPYEIVAGNPARSIRMRFDEVTIFNLLKIAWWNWPVERINSQVEYICDNNIQEFIKRNQ